MKFKRSAGHSAIAPGKKVVAGTNSHLGASSPRVRQKLLDMDQANHRGFKSTSGSGQGSAAGNIQVGSVDLGIDMSPLMEGFDLDHPDQMLFNLYRDIYHHDPVCGSATDMYATLPFSEFSIGGADDKYLAPYREAVEMLNLRTAMPEITTDHLVTGSYVSSILYSKGEKRFIDMMNHRLDNAEISPLPFYSQDPIINMKIPDDVRKTLGMDSPRIATLKKKLGSDFVTKLESGNLELDPLGTIYLPRRTFSFGEGSSWYRRVVPIYLIEKNLFRGTLVESGKRQRGIMHLQMGDGDQWEPSLDELEFMTDLFQNADLDPLGAIVATRLGVAVDEFRQGGDFWKVTDLWDQTSQFKLRALGISEAFLSGEACVVGSTLIPTVERGLVCMDDMVDPEYLKSRELQDLDLTVSSRYGQLKTKKWLYNGIRKTYKVTTDLGNMLQCTPNHPLLVLEDELSTEWVRTDRIKEGDLLCVPVIRTVRETALDLNLSEHIKFPAHSNTQRFLTRPEQMTPELAFFLGAFIAEGNWMNKDRRVVIGNSDVEYLQKCADALNDTFGFDVHVKKNERRCVGTPYSINGVEGTTNHDYYGIGIGSDQLVKWLLEMGVEPVRGERSMAHYKDIPWCILQSDVESQYAFLASYLEGDGHIHHGHKLMWISTSVKVTAKIQQMLMAMGYLPKRSKRSVKLGSIDSQDLWIHIEKYMTTKKLEVTRENKARNSYGLPARIVKDFLKERKVKDTRHGSIFLNDTGAEVRVHGYRKMPDQSFLYDCHDVGKYDNVLNTLRQVSPTMHEKVIGLLDLRYRFVKVTSIVEKSKQAVYDISMGDQEPAFVANGLIVHNTYANMEGSLTVFIESMKAFRDNLTRRIFYNKVFPLVSMMNGYAMNKKGKIITKTGLMDGDIEDKLRRMQDGSKLFIPTIHWSKQLSPEADQNRMEMLRGMQELGVPVPLRALAAAGGFNLDTLLMNQEEDMAMQRQILEYQKRFKALQKQYGGGGEEGGDDFGSFSSVMGPRSQVLAGKGRPSLAQRDFGEQSEIVGQTRTGKKKWIYDQRRANEKANDGIMKAMSSITENQATPLTHRTRTSRKPKKSELDALKRSGIS